MVGEVDECFAAGNFRVGAMVWRHHSRLERLDTDPRPMPHLAVMTPAGLVCLDCPATDLRDPSGEFIPGRYWLRMGEPPAVTVTPSLNVNHGEWHGFLTAGQLLEA